MLTNVRRAVGVGSLAAALFATLLVLLPLSAFGEDCRPPRGHFDLPSGSYICNLPGGGGDDGGGGSGGTPLCDLNKGPNPYGDKNPSGNFCKNTVTCFNIDHFAPLVLPSGPKPNEDSKARVTMCYEAGGLTVDRIFWSDDEEPSLAEQARTAIGRIDLGAGTLHVSPTNRTLVNLDTWFWTTGRERIATGSSAFGLVAIATFRTMAIETGDGSTKNCPWTTTEAEAKARCFYEYTHSSRNGTVTVGGRPAYRVEVGAIYDLTFEVDGKPIGTIPGAPATLNAPVVTVPLRVDEVQTRVTKVQ